MKGIYTFDSNYFIIFSLNISRDGVNAIFNLCDGDMRRIVNMIQVQFIIIPLVILKSLSMSLQGSNDS